MSLTRFPASRWVSPNIKSSAATSPRRVSPIQRYTACAFLRPMMSLPSHDSGTSCGTPDMCLSRWGRSPHVRYRKLKKVKKANGEIIGVNVVSTYPALSHAALKRQADGNADHTASRRLSCSAAVLFFPLDPRKETREGEELWHMASLRLALWHTQHVQGVP